MNVFRDKVIRGDSWCSSESARFEFYQSIQGWNPGLRVILTLHCCNNVDYRPCFKGFFTGYSVFLSFLTANTRFKYCNSSWCGGADTLYREASNLPSPVTASLTYNKRCLPCEQPTVLNPVSQTHTFGPVQLPCPEQLLTLSQETGS